MFIKTLTKHRRRRSVTQHHCVSVYWHSEQMCGLHLQCQEIQEDSSLTPWPMKIPKNLKSQQHCCGNLKSCKTDILHMTTTVTSHHHTHQFCSHCHGVCDPPWMKTQCQRSQLVRLGFPPLPAQSMTWLVQTPTGGAWRWVLVQWHAPPWFTPSTII